MNKLFFYKKCKGYFLLEAALSLTLLLVASMMALSMIHAASNVVRRALHQLYAEQTLFNYTALIRASGIEEDGSLILPSLGTPIYFSTSEQSFANISSQTHQSAKYLVELLTQQRQLQKIGEGSEGEVVWEYLLSVCYREPLPNGTSNEVKLTQSIWKSRAL